jgi:hypothetical protein
MGAGVRDVGDHLFAGSEPEGEVVEEGFGVLRGVGEERAEAVAAAGGGHRGASSSGFTVRRRSSPVARAAARWCGGGRGSHTDILRMFR